MSNQTLKYKGYIAKIEFSVEDKCLHGKIDGISDLVTFEADSALEIEKEFHSAVDDYLEFCAQIGKEPNKAYSGTFNIRIDPSIHKSLEVSEMPDREKVISTLEEIKTQTAGIGLDSAVIAHGFIDKVIALLKEQEALLRKLQKDKDKLCLEVSEWKHKFHDKQIKEQDGIVPYIDIDEAKCPVCKMKLTRQELIGDNVLYEDFFDYCPHCGKPVLWEGR